MTSTLQIVTPVYAWTFSYHFKRKQFKQKCQLFSTGADGQRQNSDWKIGRFYKEEEEEEEEEEEPIG